MEEDGFTLVDRSLRSHRRRAFRASVIGLQVSTAQVLCRSAARPLSAVELDAATRRLETNLATYHRQFPSEHIERVCRALRRLLAGRRLTAIRILGIGSFEWSLAAAYQLILIEYIRERFAVDDVSSQEPIASAAEMCYLRKRAVRTPSADDTSALSAAEDGLTLYYMVHCEHFMYEDVLRANSRQPKTLRQLIIIGNDLRNCDLPTTRAFVAVCSQTPLAISLEPYAFSDTWISYIDEEVEEAVEKRRLDNLDLRIRLL